MCFEVFNAGSVPSQKGMEIGGLGFSVGCLRKWSEVLIYNVKRVNTFGFKGLQASYACQSTRTISPGIDGQ